MNLIRTARSSRAWVAPVSLALAVGVLPPSSGVGLAQGRSDAVSAPQAPQASSVGASVSAGGKRQALAAYGRLPLSFVRNAGGTDSPARYSSQGPGYHIAFAPGEALLSFIKGKRGATLALRFTRANAKATPEGVRRLPGTVNYLLGNAPSGWRTSLPTYGEVVYRNLWPGIDMAFRGDKGKLKYQFVLRSGARVQDIRLAYRGTDGLSVDGRGDLLIHSSLGMMVDSNPLSYQEIRGRRVPVPSRFALGHDGAFGFAVGGYYRDRPLVIDPGLAYSTFLGGTDNDFATGIALDGSGNAFITGDTASADFPTTPGAFDPSFNGVPDAFVTKLNPTGTALAYSTYLGGEDLDRGVDIAVDGAGNAYVTGGTGSADFPTTAGAFDTSYNGVGDAFVTKLNPTGTALAYSTYLGGRDNDFGFGIAVDGAGDAYVHGHTFSADFPTTVGAFDTSFNGDFDAFVTKLNPAGTGLAYSTYLGGRDYEEGLGIAVDAGGHAYVTGFTLSEDFPTTPGAFDTSFTGVGDGFVTKLNPTGTALAYSTYLDGAAGDGIALDKDGDAYLTGNASADFPTTQGAFDTSFNGVEDAFVTKLNPTGTALAYSTYLGGGGDDIGNGIALDGSGDAYVTGQTSSEDFPTTAGAFDPSSNGDFDAFVTKLNPTGNALAYSTYLGGEFDDFATGIALDGSGEPYVIGITLSGDFPTTPGAFDTSFNGFYDAFVTKLGLGVGTPATLILSPNSATNMVGATHCVTATVEDASGNPVSGVTVRFSVPTAVATHASPASGSASTDAMGQATFCYSASLPGQDSIDAFADTNGNGTPDPGEPSATATKAWTLPPSTPSCKVTQDGWIIADNRDRATFRGNAKVGADRSLQGQEQYRDKGPAQPRNVRSIRLTAATCSADLKSATIFGTATINGFGTFVFRIDVTDGGKAGTDDTYGIITSDGYASGQKRLRGGNVTIHKR
jgi:hypothetical protein